MRRFFLPSILCAAQRGLVAKAPGVVKAETGRAVWSMLFGMLDEFDPRFNIVTP